MAEDLVTLRQLTDIYGIRTKKYCEKFIQYLNVYMRQYHIDTPIRIAAFLSQVGHESGRLVYVEELASGKAYEGRKDLGNVKAGDGARYKGRGLIQITGRANYEAITKDTGIDFVNAPTMLCEPPYAVMSACWFWNKHNLNRFADSKETESLRRAVNGGMNGYSDCYVLYLRAKKVFNV